jgi:hypothetical protein
MRATYENVKYMYKAKELDLVLFVAKRFRLISSVFPYLFVHNVSKS